MQSSRRKILIVDDDPMHLDIYSLLIRQAGYEPMQALVKFKGAQLPQADGIALVLLDYRLNSIKTSPEYAQEIRRLYPGIPIVVLSDLWTLPADIAPFVTGFVRKGEPAKLLETISRLVSDSTDG
jgi:DNA-binding NtrC family response regulator